MKFENLYISKYNIFCKSIYIYIYIYIFVIFSIISIIYFSNFDFSFKYDMKTCVLEKK